MHTLETNKSPDLDSIKSEKMPLNETAEYAIKLQAFLTAIGAVVAPTGTVTVNLPKEAVSTVA